MGFGDRSRDRRDSDRGSYSGGGRDSGRSYGGGRDSGRGGYGGGGRSFGGGRDSDRPTMHDTVCDDCGKDCQVPFRPTSGKPIFCSDCFEKKGGRESRPDRDSGRQNSGGRSQGGQDMSQQFEALSTKLDTIIDLLSPGAKPKKSKVKKTDEAAEVTLVEEKDTDLEVKSEPKKKAKKKDESPVAEEPEVVEEEKTETVKEPETEKETTPTE